MMVFVVTEKEYIEHEAYTTALFAVSGKRSAELWVSQKNEDEGWEKYETYGVSIYGTVEDALKASGGGG